MNLLALDTCSESCSAALSIDNQVYQAQTLTRQGHSKLILGMIESLFNQAGVTPAQLNQVIYGRGPGSFTGVRISASVAQGIAFAHDLPVCGVSTLAAIAQQAMDDYQADRVAVAMDARMDEVYFARFTGHAGLAQIDGEEQVIAPQEALVTGDGWFGAGSGFHEYAERLAQVSTKCEQVEPALLPQAVAMLKLASVQQAGPAAQALPVYLRDNVAHKKAQQKS